MFRKKYIITIILALAIVLIALFIFINSITLNKHNANSKADIHITSSELVNAYLTNEKKANNIYTDKLIKVSGILIDINYLNNQNTLILDNGSSASGIICELDKAELSKLSNFKKGQKIKVLGICKGFLKDVVLLNCYVETNE